MLAEKLSNPFLKSSPFLKTLPHPAHSYDSPALHTSPQSRYKNYFPNSQQLKLDSHSNFKSSTHTSIDIYDKNQSKAQINLTQMLSKNPFNRNSLATSSYLKVTKDLGSNKYPSNLNTLSPRTYSLSSNNSNYLSSPYFSKNYQIGLPVRQNILQVNHNSFQKSLANRKLSNYETGSSAQSVGSYINKIYQVDGDKLLDNKSIAISNPFYRKQLIQDRVYQKQATPINSYDLATLKYSYQNEFPNNKQHKIQNRIQNNLVNNKLQDFEPSVSNFNRPYQKQMQNIIKPKSNLKNQLNNNKLLHKIDEESKYKKYYQGYDQNQKYSFGLQNPQEQHTFNGTQRLINNDKYKFSGQYKANQKNGSDQNQQFDFNAPDKYNYKTNNNLVKDKFTSYNNIDKNLFKIQNKNDYNSQELGNAYQIGSNPLKRKQTAKFTQSHVQQYQDPTQIQNKVKNRKNAQFKQERPNIFRNQDIKKPQSFNLGQQNSSFNNFQRIGNYPSSFELNGVIFHRLNIS